MNATTRTFAFTQVTSASRKTAADASTSGIDDGQRASAARVGRGVSADCLTKDSRKSVGKEAMTSEKKLSRNFGFQEAVEVLAPKGSHSTAPATRSLDERQPLRGWSRSRALDLRRLRLRLLTVLPFGQAEVSRTMDPRPGGRQFRRPSGSFASERGASRAGGCTAAPTQAVRWPRRGCHNQSWLSRSRRILLRNWYRSCPGLDRRSRKWSLARPRSRPLHHTAFRFRNLRTQ